jgi:arylsulfatase A-like enzyme
METLLNRHIGSFQDNDIDTLMSDADRALRPLADRFGLRALLRLHRRREQPVPPCPVRRHDANRARAHGRRGRSLIEDLADKAVGWIRQQKAMAPDKPFFVYFAPGATHAPHHVPKDWIAKYKGQFDQGWDQVRAETFARQKKLGVIPAQCELTARSEGISAWDETEARLRPVLARQMEIYAAFLEYAHYHTGRVIDSLADLGILDDTLIYYIVGDNGASAEGTLIGSFNEVAVGEAPDLMTPDFPIEHIDEFGTPKRRSTTTLSAGRMR